MLNYQKVSIRANSPFRPHQSLYTHCARGRLTSDRENINKGIREYQHPTPVKVYVQVGKSTMVFGNAKIPPPSNFSLKINKGTGNTKVPPPLKPLHSLKISKKNCSLTPLNCYIHLRSEIRIRV